MNGRPHTLSRYYEKLAATLPDYQLRLELAAAQRQAQMAVRTRKDLARHRAYCFECELKRRAEQRDLRNPGKA